MRKKPTPAPESTELNRILEPNIGILESQLLNAKILIGDLSLQLHQSQLQIQLLQQEIHQMKAREIEAEELEAKTEGK